MPGYGTGSNPGSPTTYPSRINILFLSCNVSMANYKFDTSTITKRLLQHLLRWDDANVKRCSKTSSRFQPSFVLRHGPVAESAEDRSRGQCSCGPPSRRGRLSLTRKVEPLGGIDPQ